MKNDGFNNESADNKCLNGLGAEAAHGPRLKLGNLPVGTFRKGKGNYVSL